MRIKNVDIDILLIGKTGAGKSSFINYLFENEVAKVGNGDPVTQEFETYSLEENKIKLNITDSKGLEAQDFKKIENKIINMLDEREEKILIAFYCINLLNSRVEEKELELVKKISSLINQPVYILLTNCDDIKRMKDKITSMKNYLIEKIGTNTKIFSICSVEIEKRSGIAKKYGKDILLKDLFDLYSNNKKNKIAKEKSNKIIKEFIKIHNNLKTNSELLTLFSSFLLLKNYKNIQIIYKIIKSSLNNLKEIEDDLNREIAIFFEQYNFYYNQNKKIKKFQIINEIIIVLIENIFIEEVRTFFKIIKKFYLDERVDIKELSSFIKILKNSFCENLLSDNLEKLKATSYINSEYRAINNTKFNIVEEKLIDMFNIDNS